MNISTENKPLPTITDQTRPFWTAAKNGSLVLQKCQRCATFNFHPKPWCIECGSRDLQWTPAQPFGTVYSFTVSRSIAMNLAGWKEEIPLILCLIDLDDGARLYAQLTRYEPEKVQVGMPVAVHFGAISEEAGIPKFHPHHE